VLLFFLRQNVLFLAGFVTSYHKTTFLCDNIKELLAYPLFSRNDQRYGIHSLSGRTFPLSIPLIFVTPSNQFPNPPSSSIRISQPANINQETQNARKHCPLRTPGWAISSRTYPSPKHPHNHPNFDRCLNLDTLHLRPRKQNHNPPLPAVRHGFKCQWSHHSSARHQPDQRLARCSSSQTQQRDRHPRV
jgi:hypothetical protein